MATGESKGDVPQQFDRVPAIRAVSVRFRSGIPMAPFQLIAYE
jgi:hypothetical protein